MNKSPKVMAVVGIRSGSKGIPHKNIKSLLGKPLVGWILETLKKAKSVNRIVVSTDSSEYADIAKSFGAEVPTLRPKELAQKLSSDIEYIKHTLDWLRDKEGYEPDIVVRALATVPMQLPDDIDQVVSKLINEPKADSAVVIAEAKQHPHKALKLVSDDVGGKKLVTHITESSREVTPLSRQSYEKAYFRANTVACRTSVIREKDSLSGDLVRYHIIPQERAVDIDTENDFLLAELLLQKMCPKE